jgi:hypothetical protein
MHQAGESGPRDQNGREQHQALVGRGITTEVDRRREHHREQHERQHGREDERPHEGGRPRLAEDHHVAGRHHDGDDDDRRLTHRSVPAVLARANQQRLAQQ